MIKNVFSYLTTALIVFTLSCSISPAHATNLEAFSEEPVSKPAYLQPDYTSVLINGREINFDINLNTMWSNDESDTEHIAGLFDQKLNDNSYVSGHWLHLCDSHGTFVADVRVGKDPGHFFPELPVMYFDNSGNLISLTSYDIDEGYFVYSFFYDNQGRILISMETCHEVPWQDERSSYFTIYEKHWEYNPDGSFENTLIVKDEKSYLSTCN